MNTEQTAAEASEKATRKPRSGGQRAHVAPKKAKSGKTATGAKKAPKRAGKAEGARDGSKASKILELLKQEGGATLESLMKATGWRAHSVRGFLSGTIRKKMGVEVTSAKTEKGERTYQVGR